jgi:hypothetical protein
MVKIMLIRGIGIRDIGAVLQISITKVLKILKSTKYQIKPKQTRYDCLETDEFSTHVGEKEEQSVAHIRVSPGKRGNRSVCMEEDGSKDGAKAKEKDKTAGG